MDRYTRAALLFANGVRARHGLPPLSDLLSGERRSSTCCAIANTITHGMYDLTGQVGESGAWVIVLRDPEAAVPLGRDIDSTSVPPEVKTFVRRFDQGGYPQYDINPKEGSL